MLNENFLELIKKWLAKVIIVKKSNTSSDGFDSEEDDE